MQNFPIKNVFNKFTVADFMQFCIFDQSTSSKPSYSHDDPQSEQLQQHWTKAKTQIIWKIFSVKLVFEFVFGFINILNQDQFAEMFAAISRF